VANIEGRRLSSLHGHFICDAAVGALILAFAWQKLCHRERVRTLATITLKELHTNSGMTKVLRSISSEKAWADGQYLWIHSRLFWKDYDDDGDKAKALRHAWDVIEKALKMQIPTLRS
jgi:hypothetical protein